MKDIILLIFILAGFPLGIFLINKADDFLRDSHRKMDERYGLRSSKSKMAVKEPELVKPEEPVEIQSEKKAQMVDTVSQMSVVDDIDNEYWGHGVWYPSVPVGGRESVLSYSHK